MKDTLIRKTILTTRVALGNGPPYANFFVFINVSRVAAKPQNFQGTLTRAKTSLTQAVKLFGVQ